MVSSIAVSRSRARSARFSAISAGEFGVFAFEEGVAAEEIDGAVFGGGDEPGAGVFGNSGLRPLFECGEEGFLGEVFGAGRRRG